MTQPMPITSLQERLLRYFNGNRREIIALILILCIGIFLRTYHFSDWLHFEMDQAIDYDLVSPAVDFGPGHLPLLGPNVGGGLLRLGPAFYYMEYVSAVIFGNTPTGHAMQVLILSILSLPLFYIYCRRFFSTIESLGLLAVFSTSVYLVMYSRFSWSPNVLPFLFLASFYALLRSVSPGERHPARWFLTAVVAVTITSQIHFNSFFVTPLIAVAFTAIKRPRFPLKVWLAGLAIILTLYSPVILNDIHNNRENLHYLREKFDKTKPGSLVMTDTLIQTVEYDAYEFFFITTGTDLINGIKLKDYGFSCKTCGENMGLKIFSLALFLTGLVSIAIMVWKERDAKRKDFHILTLLWCLVSFYLIYSIADGYRMYPRFFLLLAPLAVILYGYILHLIQPKHGRVRFWIFISIIVTLVTLNIHAILPIFDQLRNESLSKGMEIEVGDIFPNTNRITLAQQTAIVDYIVSKYRDNEYPTYLQSESEYEPAFWALLERHGIRYRDEIRDSSLYSEGNYFDIRYADDTFDTDSKYTVLETKPFGTLTVRFFKPLDAVVVGTRQSDSEYKQSEVVTVISKLLRWDELFR